MTINELGAALLWHVNVTDNSMLSLSGGVHIAFFTPSNLLGQEEPLLAAGFRGQLAYDYRFGYKKSHVVSLVPLDVAAYTAADNTVGGLSPSALGLDNGGTVFAISLGYTKRFEDITSFITLE